MRIDRNSYGSLALVYLGCAAAAAVLLLLVHNPVISWPVIALLLWFAVWQTLFFMVPERRREGSDRKVSSVADGRVVILEKAYEPEVLKRECLQISVYMNFFDRHANFYPVSGEILSYDYHPGAHFLAFNPKSSLENEHTCVRMRNADGSELLFKQIAGGFARRIVCNAKPGQKVEAGEQCGIIKFGSRIDLFLPLDADVKVSAGQLVRSCESVLAELR